MMTVPEILQELEPYTGRFPMRAMEAAIEQREAITPELLKMLDSVAAAAVSTSYLAPKPYVNQPKIGRNDSCPCGSGKKFKKCRGKG